MQNVCDTKNAAFLAFEPGFTQRAVGKSHHVANTRLAVSVLTPVYQTWQQELKPPLRGVTLAQR